MCEPRHDFERRFARRYESYLDEGSARWTRGD